jgi:ABC-type branched-subunit amino acid transport system substrate-binding protein
LTWANLLKPAGHVHPSGRRHQAFDEAGVKRAITTGVDASGNALAPIMPRYRMSDTDLSDLIAYLKRIATDFGTGVTPVGVKVGAVLPLTGLAAGAGLAAQEVLNAYFSEVNEGGGIFRRKVELRVLDGGVPGGVGVLPQIRRLADEEQVFAVLSGYDAGGGPEVARLISEAGIPLLSLNAGAVDAVPKPDRYFFQLLPDVRSRAKALVAFAARERGPRKSRLVVLYPEDDAEPALVTAVEEVGRADGYTSVLKVGYGRGKSASARALKALGGAGADDVILLASGGEEGRAMLRGLSAAKSVAALLLPDPPESGDLLSAVAHGAAGNIYVATGAWSVDPAGAPAEYLEFSRKHGLGSSHQAERLAAYAAAKTLAEGLKIAGKDLNQEQFVDALESLRDFDTGAAFKVSFGPARRVGSGAVHILRVDTKRRVLTPVPGAAGTD